MPIPSRGRAKGLPLPQNLFPTQLANAPADNFDQSPCPFSWRQRRAACRRLVRLDGDVLVLHFWIRSPTFGTQ